MGIIQERTRAVEKAWEKVKDHPMCAMSYDDGYRFVVFYPEGDFSTHGVRVDHSSNGKAWALEKLHEIMEREWVASYP